MPVGTTWQAEWREHTDPVTGVPVRQLANYKAHTHHLYFTNPGWYCDGRKLLLGSERDNRTNLVSLDLGTGGITQVTDLDQPALPHEIQLLRVCVNPVRAEAYVLEYPWFCAVDLETLELRRLWEMPKGYLESMLNVSADGKMLYVGLFQDLSDRIRIDYERGYVGFAETFHAKPHSMIVEISTDGSGSRVVHEEQTWVGHVNTSPTRRHLLTFCHEGPWELVDNRIWCLNVDTQETWKVRPRREGVNEAIGHEYWHADGLNIGYHGAVVGGEKLFGKIRYDNTEQVETSFPHETGHIHSNDFSLIVGDAGAYIRLWKWNGESFDGPRVLCEHHSSGHIQIAHPHPRFTPDGKHVLFTSDVSGYCNPYLAEVPEFESLPRLEDVR